jgi:hypothetical protein
MGRATYQNLNNVCFKSKAIATGMEERQINKAIGYLREAKKAENEEAFVVLMTEAFKLTRNVSRGRIL